MNGFILAAAFVALVLWAFVALVRWAGKTFRTVKTQMAVDKKADIVARNDEIVKKYLGMVYDSSQHFHIENTVRGCIGEIARREGLSYLAPKSREWIREWEKRPDIPAEYQHLKQQLTNIFQARLQEKIAEKIETNEERERVRRAESDRQTQEFFEKRMRDGQALYDSNIEVVNKFLEITERKVSILDDYGDENWDALETEIDGCLAKIAKRASTTIARHHGRYVFSPPYEWLKGKLDKDFREYHKLQKQDSSCPIDVSVLEGTEFETYIARKLKAIGYDDVCGTPASGDQGADLIAKKNGRTIIIQAKRYAGTVGNKAVQEVASAVSFYGGDEGWVITNSTFTPSAKALAQKTSVRLFEGRDLERLEELLRSSR